MCVVRWKAMKRERTKVRVNAQAETRQLRHVIIQSRWRPLYLLRRAHEKENSDALSGAATQRDLMLKEARRRFVG